MWLWRLLPVFSDRIWLQRLKQGERSEVGRSSKIICFFLTWPKLSSAWLVLPRHIEIIFTDVNVTWGWMVFTGLRRDSPPLIFSMYMTLIQRLIWAPCLCRRHLSRCFLKQAGCRCWWQIRMTSMAYFPANDSLCAFFSLPTLFLMGWMCSLNRVY